MEEVQAVFELWDGLIILAAVVKVGVFAFVGWNVLLGEHCFRLDRGRVF